MLLIVPISGPDEGTIAATFACSPDTAVIFAWFDPANILLVAAIAVVNMMKPRVAAPGRLLRNGCTLSVDVFGSQLITLPLAVSPSRTNLDAITSPGLKSPKISSSVKSTKSGIEQTTAGGLAPSYPIPASNTDTSSSLPEIVANAVAPPPDLSTPVNLGNVE